MFEYISCMYHNLKSHLLLNEQSRFPCLDGRESNLKDIKFSGKQEWENDALSHGIST